MDLPERLSVFSSARTTLETDNNHPTFLHPPSHPPSLPQSAALTSTLPQLATFDPSLTADDSTGSRKMARDDDYDYDDDDNKNTRTSRPTLVLLG